MILERRRHTRILTLKNFGTFVLATLAILVAANVVSEIRRPASGDYGRLVSRELPSNDLPAPKAQPIVREAPSGDGNSADPMLFAPVAREQQQYVAANATASAPATPEPAFSSSALVAQPHGHISIVGDSSGVSIVTQTTPGAQKLNGGIFKR